MNKVGTGTEAVSAVAVAPVPAIRADALSKSYDPARPVLRDISLAIRPGERVALIGPNGSGKSTLLRCLIGLHAPSGGTLEVLGQPLHGHATRRARAHVRGRTGMVFQHHALVRRRVALSNVLHGLLHRPGGWRALSHQTAPSDWRARGMAALEAVGLADRALDRVDALSGGQQQRVAIARALVRDPEFLIADEPAASLDPAAGRDVMALFARLCAERGITLLYTSHDMAHARDYSDRIVALRDGQVQFDTPSHDLSAEHLQESFDG
ncbi:phosphonate ABC transporter ATP-binding protein [Pontivivens ytuae]|uniref:ATP-binding cassette domain-containing protein n=1 Tax=Pontivivens ytuae TaxID=2789856 RepID=A0A7S9QBT2_9RHOB|nr:ATP-binding cassette domain-containing protein [Pontivivens ytuae]QPH53213.1 ATP-binding cassette domain-containing protein [Pontivivens ytuae]